MTTQELKQYIDKVLGNSIRCLLPSYWWKRLFSLTLEKVDEKLDATNIKTINGESIVGEGNLKVGVTTVGSIDELNTLEASVGDIATVGEESAMLVRAGDLPQVDVPNEILEKWDNLTRIVKVEFGEPVTENGRQAIVYLNGKKPYNYDTILISSSEGGFFCAHIVAGEIKEITIEEVNERLKKHDYRFMMGSNGDAIDSTFKLHAYSASADAYIKGDSWERLAKESDLEGIEGGSGEDNVVTFYAPIDNVSLSDTEKQHNAESHQKVTEGFESDKYYDIKVLLSTSQLVALDVIKTINPASDNGRLKLIFGGVGSGIDLQMLTVTSDGSATTEKVEGGEGGSSITIDSELSDTSTNAVQNKAVKAYIDEKVANMDIDTSNLATKEDLNAYATSESLQSLGLRIQNDMDTDKRELTEAINTKQDKIDDLEAIRGGAALGATALQEHQDISHLATKEEVIANEEVTAAALNDLNDKLGKLAENVQGETVTKEEFETAVNNLNESLSGKADAQTTSEALTALSGQVETAVTSEQLSSAVDNINNTILENEEVTAAALNDLNDRIKEIITRLNNVGL